MIRNILCTMIYVVNYCEFHSKTFWKFTSSRLLFNYCCFKASSIYIIKLGSEHIYEINFNQSVKNIFEPLWLTMCESSLIGTKFTRDCKRLAIHYTYVFLTMHCPGVSSLISLLRHSVSYH